MYSITIVFGPTCAQWALLYQTEENWNAANSELIKQRLSGSSRINLADDFSQSASINSEQIVAVLSEDLEKSKLAHIEQGLHRSRMQVKANQMAQSDPVLRTAQMTSGPSVYNPMGANGFRPS